MEERTLPLEEWPEAMLGTGRCQSAADQLCSAPANRISGAGGPCARGEIKQMHFDLAAIGETNAYKLLISTVVPRRSEEHTSELQSHSDLVCRLLLEKKKKR